MNDSKFLLWRTAAEVILRNKAQVSARLAEVLGPCEAQISDDTGFSDGPTKYTLRVNSPWRAESAWFQEISGYLLGSEFTAEVRGWMVLTPANAERARAGYEAIGAELRQFAKDVEALSVAPEWIAELAQRDAAEKAARETAEAVQAALAVKRSEYKITRKGDTRRIVGPGCDLLLEEHRRYGYGKQWQADARGLGKKGDQCFCGDTQGEVLLQVQYHFVPNPPVTRRA